MENERNTMMGEKKTSIEEKHSDRVQIIIVRFGEEEYGLSIDQVKEVVMAPNITKLPQTPSYIKGVANIRGNVIAIIDLNERFNGEGTSTELINKSNYYTLVFESDEYNVGILVKEVPNTMTVAKKDIEEATHIGNDSTALGNNYIKGIVKYENRLIILIDLYKVLENNDMLGFVSSSSLMG